MTDLEILQELRQKLSDPAAWHKGSWFARVPWIFGNSNVVKEANRAAAATDCPACIGGWLARITGSEPWLIGQSPKSFCRIEQKLQDAMEQKFYEPDLDVPPPSDLLEWNDLADTEHKDILLVIDIAINRELKAGP